VTLKLDAACNSETSAALPTHTVYRPKSRTSIKRASSAHAQAGHWNHWNDQEDEVMTVQTECMYHKEKTKEDLKKANKYGTV
jgi:hypothetical protein